MEVNYSKDNHHKFFYFSSILTNLIHAFKLYGFSWYCYHHSVFHHLNFSIWSCASLHSIGGDNTPDRGLTSKEADPCAHSWQPFLFCPFYYSSKSTCFWQFQACLDEGTHIMLQSAQSLPHPLFYIVTSKEDHPAKRSRAQE